MKKEFLELTEVKNEADAMRSSINAALQHNKTYNDRATDNERLIFRENFADEIRKRASNYHEPVSDEGHIQNIKEICDQLSTTHDQILVDSKLRFGTSQKALNLYLKFLWCLDPKMPEPPHCPVDGVILKKARIDGSWTKLDSADLYMAWINELKKVSIQAGFGSLQQWELAVWKG